MQFEVSQPLTSLVVSNLPLSFTLHLRPQKYDNFVPSTITTDYGNNKSYFSWFHGASFILQKEKIQYNRPPNSKEKIRITYPPSQIPINLNCVNFKKYPKKKKSRVNIYHN